MNRRNWLLLILLTVAAFAGLLVYGDLREVSSLLASAPSPYAGLAAALGLAVVNYVLRYLRWAIYLRALDIQVSSSVSASVFVAGLALSITPGKAGELLKSVWLNRRAGVPVSASAPAVVMEHLTDVVSVGLLGLTGIVLLPTAVALIVGSILVVAVIAGILAASRYGEFALRLPVLRRWREPLAQSLDGFRRLMSPAMLTVAVILGALAWAAEGLALWIVIVGIGEWVSPLIAVPISAAAALVGAVTALPGGLVGFEGSMVALLRQAGLGAPEAALATLLTRLATLWFAVLIGLVAWVWISRTGGAEGQPKTRQEITADNQ
ncbi:MAG: flippase-like domain-containing protein [Chloroflexi bacterium]|nr:flippase-like domain-containing protein [Chloroflexota bacterium]